LIFTAFWHAEEGKCDMSVQLLVIESIISTILSLGKIEEAKNVLESFVGGLLQTKMKELLLALEREGGREEDVGKGLQLFGQVVRFLDGKTQEETMYVAEGLVREAWPLLEQAAEVGWRGGERGRVVLDQLFPLYRYSVMGLRRVVGPMLGNLLRVILGLFEETLHEGALETVGRWGT